MAEDYGLQADHPALLRIRELEKQAMPAGSHHGSPDLSRHDITLLEAYTKWVTTAKKTGQLGYGADWLPTHVDWLKSRLFWRIRSGREPLKYPPPRAYSCPWYELIEIPGPHDVFEQIRAWEGGKVVVAQCQFDVVEKETDSEKGEVWTLAYGPYRFRAWNGPITRKKIVGKEVTEFEDWCGWIEYVGCSDGEGTGTTS